jgi:hypothetical protein
MKSATVERSMGSASRRQEDAIGIYAALGVKLVDDETFAAKTMTPNRYCQFGKSPLVAFSATGVRIRNSTIVPPWCDLGHSRPSVHPCFSQRHA